MKELEITVKVNCSLKELDEYLLNNGFKIVDKYDCYDKYLINKDINISNMKDLDVIKKCILLRDIIGIKKSITSKNKIYDHNGRITKQEKIDCVVDDLSLALKFMESINFRVLLEIYDKIIVYSNGEIEICSQYVNDKYLFIEMEDTAFKTPKHDYDNLDSMINDFDKIGIDYDNSNYFVSKAEIILNEVRKCL